MPQKQMIIKHTNEFVLSGLENRSIQNGMNKQINKIIKYIMEYTIVQ